MKDILARAFVAVDVKGDEYYIGDLTQYLRNIGFSAFLKQFGFDLGKVWYENLYIPQLHKGALEHLYHVKAVPRSDYQYILMDVNGKHYSPDYIVSLLVKVVPNIADAIWQNDLKRFVSRYKRASGVSQTKARRRAKYKSLPFKRRLWQQSLSLEEEGLATVRNLKDYFTCPYDDDWYRRPERNWKRFRKTQYK